MSKGFKLATLTGAVALAISANVSAIDFNYGGWTVANGDITENTTNSMCDTTSTTSTISCSVVASGKGFKQINVTDSTDPTGESYIMTIVTDQDATGTAGTNLGFSDVSFVKMKLTLGGNADNGESGITSQQRIVDKTVAGKDFVSNTDINTGWASGTGANISITQDLTDDAGTDTFAGDDFISGFSYSSNNHAETGERTGFKMTIDQVARLSQGAGGTDINDAQVFVLREKQGDMQKVAASGGGIDLNGDGLGVVSWTVDDAVRDATTGAITSGSVGDDIKAIWIGQEINLGTSTDLASGSLGSSFGYVAFEATDSNGAVTKDNAFGFSATNSESAWAWDPAFDAAPSMTGMLNP